jgi:hypothetical protein
MSHFTFARSAALAAAMMLVGPLALAEDVHHPGAPSAPQAAQPAPGPQQGTPDMMRMMQHMHEMHQMMGMGQSAGSGMGGMGMGGGMPMQMMTEHVEGRIAFLRAELKITPAQSAAWDEFAETLRANAKRMSGMGGMMGQGGSGQATLPQRAVNEERMLEARLEGVRKMRAALDKLYSGFTEEQKKLAETLMPPHFGMMPMAMGRR